MPMCGCSCDPENPLEEGPGYTGIGLPAVRVDPKKNKFRARGYSLTIAEVQQVINEARKDGFPIMST